MSNVQACFSFRLNFGERGGGERGVKLNEKNLPKNL
jgi:hypothetical protein